MRWCKLPGRVVVVWKFLTLSGVVSYSPTEHNMSYLTFHFDTVNDNLASCHFDVLDLRFGYSFRVFSGCVQS